MANEINQLTELAHDRSGLALSIAPVVGTPTRPSADLFVSAKPMATVPRRRA